MSALDCIAVVVVRGADVSYGSEAAFTISVADDRK